jgi:FkbM family methyltransferase
MLNPADLVFDIGANLGDKTEWFASKGLAVVAVEPQPEILDQLISRFKGLLNVTICPFGVGRKRERLEMSISTHGHVLSTFADHWKKGRFSQVDWDRRAEVQIVTLDDLVSEYGMPKYCKVDVEGYEREVIGGLSQKIGIISYEFTNEYMEHAYECLDRLKLLGYCKFNISLGESEKFNFLQWLSSDDLIDEISLLRGQEDLWGDIYAYY